MRFAILPVHLPKLLRVPRKSDARSIRSAAPVTQNHLSKPEDLRLQNATLLRKSAPWPPNSCDEHVSCAAPATENASLQILFKCPTPAIVFGNATKPWRFAHFWQGAQSLAPATRNDISTSKSGANMWCFYVLFTFWLRNVLRATTACTFSTFQLPKVLRTWGVFFQWFEAPEGRKVGSLKRPVRSQLAHERWKSARRCGAKHISKSKCTKHTTFGPLLDVQSSFRVAGARDCAPCQMWAKYEGFVASPKRMAGVGHLKGICKDAFSVAGAAQETCSSELLTGQGADFLRGVAFWSIRSLGLLRWFCVTGAALRMTWHHFFVAGAIVSTDGLEKSQNVLARGRQLCSQLSIFAGSLAELLRFWCCQVWKMKKSRRIASFWMLSSSKNEEVSQNCFVFDVVNFENEEASQNCFVFDVVKFKTWGRLAE